MSLYLSSELIRQFEIAVQESERDPYPSNFPGSCQSCRGGLRLGPLIKTGRTLLFTEAPGSIKGIEQLACAIGCPLGRHNGISLRDRRSSGYHNICDRGSEFKGFLISHFSVFPSSFYAPFLLLMNYGTPHATNKRCTKMPFVLKMSKLET